MCPGANARIYRITRPMHGSSAERWGGNWEGGGVQQSASGSTNMFTSAQILKSHPRSAQCVSVGLSAGHNGETRGMHALISPMYLIRVAR